LAGEACSTALQSLVSQLQSLLRDLGIERRVKTVPDLTAYLVAAKEA
jgi:hypothetical protein